jgi:hypothetical protein
MADEPVTRSERIRRAMERLSGSADIKMTTDEIMELTRGEGRSAHNEKTAAGESVSEESR